MIKLAALFLIGLLFTAYQNNVQSKEFNNSPLLSLSPNSVSVSSISTIAGTGHYGYSDGNGNSAEFNNPMGVAVDSTGNIYVADSANQRIRKISNNLNHTVTTIAGSGKYDNETGLNLEGEGYQDGNGIYAKFNNPTRLAVDSLGNIYVTDTFNHKIRKIANDINHTVSTISGSNEGYQDGTNLAKFNAPRGIAIDSLGNIYVADTDNHKIRKIANDANHTASTIAGSNQGYQDGNSKSAKFNGPCGLVLDKLGNIYVADTGNNKIRKISNDFNHTVSTIAGGFEDNYGYQDGNGNLARFSGPQGIDIDSDGNIFVGDTMNNKIRKIANDVNYTVSTIIGNFIDKDGNSFSTPQGIAIDLSGNIYVADFINNKIRKIEKQ